MTCMVTTTKEEVPEHDDIGIVVVLGDTFP